MNDIIWVIILLIGIIIYKILNPYLSLYTIFLVLLLCFLIFQYIFINSNPYRNFNTNKLTILNFISDKYKPPSEYYNPQKEYRYPFILKPVVCTGNSSKVSLIKNSKQLTNYFTHNKISKTMYQEYIDSNYEVGILYERNPLKKNGTIKSIVLRTFLKRDIIYLEGNKLRYDYRNYINLKHLITPQLNRIIDTISKSIPNFYVGRYDIRCHSLTDLSNGRFYILEVNGPMGFDLTRYTFPKPQFNFDVWVSINLRWLLIRLYYGLINMCIGNSINPSILGVAMYSTITCRDMEQLFEPMS
jgi:hypothetical protein